MRDVAVHAGVSVNAVSLALRSDPSIPPGTRERICRSARELGYQLNPLVSAIMRQQRSRHPAATGNVVAFLTFGNHPQAWKLVEEQRCQWEGMQERAQAHGFRCEPIWAGDPAISRKRLNQILMARGIRGLIVGSLAEGECRLNLEWEEFCAVAIGRSIEEPRLDRVSPAWFHGNSEVFLNLDAMGFRRIGVVLPRILDKRMERAATAVWADWAVGRTDAVPLLRTGAEDGNIDDVFEWWKTYSPDVVVSFQDFRQEFMHRGIDSENHSAWAFLSIPAGVTGVAGIRFDYATLGGMAMDHLVSLMLGNSTGLPERPREILLEGEWSADGLCAMERGRFSDQLQIKKRNACYRQTAALS